MVSWFHEIGGNFGIKNRRFFVVGVLLQAVLDEIFCGKNIFHVPEISDFFRVARLRYVVSNDEMKVRRNTPLNP